MCDFNKIAGWLIAAQILYLGMLVTLGIAVINSGSFWLSALNIPLMIIVCIACAAATVLAGLALNEANNCKATVCGTAANSLASWLTAFVVNLGILTGLLIAAAILAPVPFAGAIAVGAVVIWMLTLAAGISAIVENGVAQAMSEFNACQAANNASANAAANTVVRVVAVITAVVIAVMLIGGGVSNYVPFGFDH
jgi:hypothetical protein